VGTGGIINTYAGIGTSFGTSGDNGPATKAVLLDPTAVAVDSSGDLFIADRVIRMVNAGGTITTVAGNLAAPLPFSGHGGPAVLAGFATPRGLARDAAGNLYVADWTGNRVRKIDSSGVISTFAGTGSGPDSGDGGQAAAAAVSTPFTVVADAGNLYVAGFGRI